MAPELAPRVFEPFERERSSTQSGQQGTGLGLAITRNIAELMGGAIAVESAPGKGSCFTLRVPFPYSRPPEQAGPAAGHGIHCDMDFKGMRILLAEDNAINREISEMILHDAGFEVDAVVNGKEAVDRVAGSRPGHYDAVLMDIQMPVMNGYEATEAIRSLPGDYCRNLPIIAMSANAYEEDVRTCLDIGMNAHIAKPFQPEQLYKLLERLV